MEQSKLVRLFKSLTPPEIKDFGKFLEGNYRQNGGVIILYNYLRKQSSNWEEAKLNAEKVNKVIYKAIGKKVETNPSHYKFLNDLKSKLYAELEGFLILAKLSQDYTQKGQLMLEIFRERGIDNLFFNRAEQIKKKWEVEPPEGIDYLYQRFRMFLIINNHEKTPNLIKNQALLLEDLDRFYISQKLFWVNNYLKNGEMAFSDGSLESPYMLEETLATSDLPVFRKVSQLKLQRDIYKCIFENNGDYFRIKDYFFNHIAEYNFDEKYDIYMLLSYMCQQSLGNSKKGFEERFELRRLSIDVNIFFGGKWASIAVFKSTVNLACAAGKFNWAQNFIDSYISQIIPMHREVTKILCRSTLALYQKRCDWILKNLGPVNFISLNDKLYGRMLILQAYYELDDKQAFKTYVPSVNQFLRNNKNFSHTVTNRYLLFVRLLRQLFELKISTNRYRVKKINIQDLYDFKQKVKNVGKLPRKVWLSQKIEEQIGLWEKKEKHLN